MFSSLPEIKKEAFIYLPKHTNVPTLDSPQCYYFSFLHLLSMQRSQINIPCYVEEIVDRCKVEPDFDKYREIMITKLKEHRKEIAWIEDEIRADQGEDYNGNWIEDFVDRYGVDFAMARLLNLSVTEFNDIDIEQKLLTTEQLKNILATYGPVVIRIKQGIVFSPNKLFATEIISTSDELLNKNVYNIEKYLKGASHSILLIGFKEEIKKQVYFIDPNFPQIILSMDFNLFKEKILIGEFVHFNKNNLKEDEVIFPSVNKRKNNAIEFERKRIRKEEYQNPSSKYEVSASQVFKCVHNGISMWQIPSDSISPKISDDDSLIFPELSKFFDLT